MEPSYYQNGTHQNGTFISKRNSSGMEPILSKGILIKMEHSYKNRNTHIIKMEHSSKWNTHIKIGTLILSKGTLIKNGTLIKMEHSLLSASHLLEYLPRQVGSRTVVVWVKGHAVTLTFIKRIDGNRKHPHKVTLHLWLHCLIVRNLGVVPSSNTCALIFSFLGFVPSGLGFRSNGTLIISMPWIIAKSLGSSFNDLLS